ncbi:p450 domain-containing protein [Cephalotus follicularis]|uniref:p450 domain-containing protein n=1 Tax=Cephalotus follicularis TaxID=3775 RepID=A0A1Q3CL94_CEPFO|nr:p450 domain-containing protein [Cephalotus follicularis]
MSSVGLLSLLFHPLFITSLAVFLSLLFKKFFTAPNKKISLPSPSKLPIIGNLHQIGYLPHRSLKIMAQNHGSLMLLHFGIVPVLVVSSADAACEIMKTHDLIFASRPKSKAFEKLLYNYKDVAAAPYGEYWRQMRSICVFHLLNKKMVESFRKVREEETTLMVEKIRKLSSSSLPMNLSEIVATLSNDVICRVAIGKKYNGGDCGTRFTKLVKELEELLGGFNLGDYLPWLAWVSRVNGLDAQQEKVAKGLDEILDGVVREHIDRLKNGIDAHGSVQGEEQKDFVDVLLSIQKENTTGFSVDPVNIKAIILDVLVGGTDTTSTTVEWTMAELLRHPKVMKELQNELRTVAGDKSYITEDNLAMLHYLKAVIKESLRLHPPLPLLVPRESTKDVNIKGYDIEAKTQIYVNVYAIGTDPTSWEHAEEFLPDRFLNNSIDFTGHHFQFTPFGAGRRGCPGAGFAMAITELTLANLIYKFDWALPGGAGEQNLDMTESTGLTARKKFPLTVVSTPYSF